MTEYIRKHPREVWIAACVAVLCVLAVAAGIRDHRNTNTAEAEAGQPAEEETIAAISSLTKEELEEMREEELLDDTVSEYGRFGMVDVNGYINLRSRPDALDMKNIIGRLADGAAVDIVETDGEWMLVSSGGIRGYVNGSYILEGAKAEEKAADLMKERVLVDVEVLNIRSAPEISNENVIGKARLGERYELVNREGEWARILVESDTAPGELAEGYVKVSDGNAEIRRCFDEARRIDLRMMALTQYDDLVFAYPEGGYINIRKDPSDKGIDNICGKFMKGCGAELLETVENSAGSWYKIRSGKVTGYVSAAYCLTGQSAKDIAVDYAVLTAFVKVDALNVRTDPSFDGKVWTSITKNQAYEVIGQFDGWVELELDLSDSDNSNDRAFVSTRDNNVEVRYGLPEAVEYYPAVEAANAAMAYRNSVVNYACQFIGNPYVWGGTSLTRGADCSGFVQSVMAHFGIYLPRTSRDQAGAGRRVTSDQMKPGDLVFYANSSGRINHVGIYIGNGQIVNASTPKSGIKISRWNYRTPAAIRNVIGS